MTSWADVRCEPSHAEQLRSVQVELTNQQHNAIKTSWPGIGCWFWWAEEFRPDGYKRFIDLHEKHSGFRFLTTSIRHSVEVTDPSVHDHIKRAAEYARAHGMAMVMDLDVRLARQAFMDKYPGEMQEIVRLREVGLPGAGNATISIDSFSCGDHYTYAARHYDSLSARLLRVYSYVNGPQGVEPDSIKNITDRCKTTQADAKGLKLSIPCMMEDKGRTACVLGAFTLFTPDVFAPHLVAFERAIIQQYADVPLAGACKDEWGFPGRFAPRTDDLYFSSAMANVYAKRRPGRDLTRDLLLMFKNEKGWERERIAAINHYMEMVWQRNGEIETAFYKSVKEVFGNDAMSGTHPTWISFPGKEEIFKNGLDWWAATRDLAQTDEATPYCVRTALAKKWHSPLWYNMYYEGTLSAYAEDIWRHVLGGGRMNIHPLWPHPVEKLTTSLLSGDLLRAECRIRLLNYISTGAIDCPVAVVFGHPSATNWAGTGLANVGMDVCNGLWSEGYYADLIPTSEIASGALKITEDGGIQYGAQKYAAVVLFHPQYDRAGVADFFKMAAKEGTTALYRVGEWTMDFEGNAFHADLPPEMKARDEATCVRDTIAHLKSIGIESQTPSTMHGSAGCQPSMMPRPCGQCRLLDGTVIMACGEKNVMGDPIKKTISVSGCDVTFDAVGVAAVRLDKKGRVEAMAAGGLKSFRSADMSIELAQRVDVALWRNEQGKMRGVLQDWTGPVPPDLAAITDNWLRLAVPKPLTLSLGKDEAVPILPAGMTPAGRCGHGAGRQMSEAIQP